MNKNKIRLNNKPINLVLIVLFFMYSFTAFSQERIISGTVNDSYGNPIPGVNILQETQKSNGAVTDFDGNFTIAISDKSKLIFSYVGFITKKVETINQNNLQVTLEEDLLGLDEVTVVAYGTQKKGKCYCCSN
jgi:iron complex outermembrane receptor protein